MSKFKFREIAPQRTYKGPELTNYKKYKADLQKDFHKRCCYTDCPDKWFGGKTNMDIEHFKPKSKYPKLTTKYANLAYSNPFANRAKAADWQEDMYLDPCDVDYNTHFSRDEQGNIVPLTQQAKYMYKRLKLYLERYGIIWMLDTMQQKLRILSAHIDKISDPTKKQKCMLLHYELSKHFQAYLDYLDLD
ncbi:MAG: hypothetical protein AAF380_02890 [Bacteroidota bacterium]